MTAPHGVHGLEVEYVTVLDPRSRLSPREVCLRLLAATPAAGGDGVEKVLGDRHVAADPDDLWLRNGARLHVEDSPIVPEYAGPECAAIADIVAADRAGDHIVSALEAGYNVAAAPVDRVRLLRMNARSRRETIGSDENHAVPAQVTNIDLGACGGGIVPHLVSRALYTGAGVVTAHGDGWRYGLSARASHLAGSVGYHRGAGDGRYMVKTVNDYTNEAPLRRVEVASGDTTMSARATFLRFAPTAILLDMLLRPEHRAWFQSMAIVGNPVEALQRVSEDVSWATGEAGRTPLIRLAGRSAPVSALHLQQLLHERASEHVDSLGQPPAEWQLALHWWGEDLDALSGDLSGLQGGPDWHTKRSFIQERLAEAGATGTEAVVEALRSDARYHRIGPGSPFARLEREGRVRAPFVDGADRLLSAPPEGRRAEARGALVRALSAAGVMGDISWERVLYRSQGEERDVVLDDPRAPWTAEARRAVVDLTPPVVIAARTPADTPVAAPRMGVT